MSIEMITDRYGILKSSKGKMARITAQVLCLTILLIGITANDLQLVRICC